MIQCGVLLAVWMSLCVSSIRARSSLSVRELYFSPSLLCHLCACCVCGRRPYLDFFCERRMMSITWEIAHICQSWWAGLRRRNFCELDAEMERTPAANDARIFKSGCSSVLVNRALCVLQDTTGSPLSFQPLATQLPRYTKNTSVFITVISVSTTKHVGTSILTRMLVTGASDMTCSIVSVTDEMDMRT